MQRSHKFLKPFLRRQIMEHYWITLDERVT